jgi:hypothetical protein
VDVRPTSLSPVVDAGAILAAEYEYDLMGIDQNQFGAGWEIGSLTFVPESPGQAMGAP